MIGPFPVHFGGFSTFLPTILPPQAPPPTTVVESSLVLVSFDDDDFAARLVIGSPISSVSLRPAEPDEDLGGLIGAALEGDDQRSGSTGRDTLLGGDGADTISGNGGAD